MAHRWNLIALLVLLAGIALWLSLATRPKEPPAATAQTPVQSRPTHTATPAATPAATPGTPAPAQSPSPSPSLEMLEGSLPNLVVVDVVYEDPYVKVLYANNGGSDLAADFTISLSANGRTFDGNSNYRNVVPEPGVICKSGGFSPGLVGLEPGQSAELLVSIDPEDRVREISESDNTLLCKVDIGRGTVRTLPQPTASADLPSDGPDLIVSNAQLADSELTITFGNQGNRGSGSLFSMEVIHKGEVVETLNGLTVPDPGETMLFMNLHAPYLRSSDLIEIKIDTTGTVDESREGNNSYIRQLDNSHQL